MLLVYGYKKFNGTRTVMYCLNCVNSGEVRDGTLTPMTQSDIASYCVDGNDECSVCESCVNHIALDQFSGWDDMPMDVGDPTTLEDAQRRIRQLEQLAIVIASASLRQPQYDESMLAWPSGLGVAEKVRAYANTLLGRP